MAEAPFFTKSAVLQVYLSTDAAILGSELVGVIAKSLRENQDQYMYFFTHRPDSSWATALDSHGFFENAPELVENKGNYFAPYWYEQEYLISVAKEAPQAVINHIRKLKGPTYYYTRALKALQTLGISEFQDVLPELVSWIENPQIAVGIGADVLGLVQKIAKENNENVGGLFDLFELVTRPQAPVKPVDSEEVFLRSRSSALFPLDDYEGRDLHSTVNELKFVDPVRTISILEAQLRTTMNQEAEVWGTPVEARFSSFWRSSIEESGQDNITDYKGELVSSLRDSVTYLAEINEEEFKRLIERFVADPNEIFRRIGLYFLGEYPQRFDALVRDILLDPASLDDIGIHHELFLLLRKGFPVLAINEQHELINSILLGPSDRLQPSENEDTERINARRDVWIRERLSMLEDFLEGDARAHYDDLLVRYGRPSHPEFTHWVGNAFVVTQVSPKTAEELAQYSADELLDFLRTWQPLGSNGPREQTYSALAHEVSKLVLSNKAYKDVVWEIAILGPSFAVALVSLPSIEAEDFDTQLLQQLTVARKLLEIDVIRNSIERLPVGQWTSFRFALVNSIERLIQNADWQPEEEQIELLFDVLFILCDDPDPSHESDRPDEGWLGHNDPMTVAINHVRPSAVDALINLHHRLESDKHRREMDESGNEKLLYRGEFPERIRTILTNKVRRDLEPSLAVHSLFGKNLNLLYWLDRSWTEEYVDEVFPVGEDEESIRFFVAAWDSWVSNSFVFFEVFELLRTRYERAIENAQKGFVSKTFNPVRNLASHLLLEYRTAEYDISSLEGRNSLLAKFFEMATPDQRGEAAWVVSRDLGRNPEFWPKVKALWEWRLNAAMMAKSSDDFRPEISGFSSLLNRVPADESMESMWRLLEGLLPYLEGSNLQDRIWHNLETYLAERVSEEQLDVLRLYSLMHDQITTARPYYGKEATKILEFPAEEEPQRTKVIELIDKLRRMGNFQFEGVQKRLLRTG